MKRIWYWPAWKMTEPFKVGVWSGGDEFLRRTSCLSLGPLGTFIYAHEDDAWYERINEATQAYLAALDGKSDAIEINQRPGAQSSSSTPMEKLSFRDADPAGGDE